MHDWPILATNSVQLAPVACSISSVLTAAAAIIVSEPGFSEPAGLAISGLAAVSDGGGWASAGTAAAAPADVANGGAAVDVSG